MTGTAALLCVGGGGHSSSCASCFGTLGTDGTTVDFKICLEANPIRYSMSVNSHSAKWSLHECMRMLGKGSTSI